MRKVIIVCFFVFGIIVNVGAQESFYKGKTLQFIVGYAAGGGYDTYTRLIARHIGRHIAGNPLTVVENRTGAGGLIAVNFLYNQAKPDGLTIGNWNGMLALQQKLGLSGAQFDGQKFEAVGAPINQNQVCVLAKKSGIQTMHDWLVSSRPIKLGGLGPGTSPSDMARILEAALALPIQLVEGYKGGAEVRLAFDSGEVEGMCGLAWEIAKSTWRKQLDDANILVQGVEKPHPELLAVPLAIDFAKNADARELIRIGIHQVSKVLQIYSLPPGTSIERVKIIRRAFEQTLKDPAFLAEARKSQLDISWTSGEDVDNIIASFAKLSPAISSKLKDVLLPEKH